MYIYVYWFNKLFSTHSSLNLVGFHLSFSFTKHVILLTPFFSPLFKLSVDPTLSYCGGYLLKLLPRLGGYLCNNHWTVMLSLYYILSSIYCIYVVIMIIWVLSNCFMLWHSCSAGGCCFMIYIDDWIFCDEIWGYCIELV